MGQAQALHVNCVQKERPKLLTRVAQRTGGCGSGRGRGGGGEENSLSAQRGKVSTSSFPAECRKGTSRHPLKFPREQEAACALPFIPSWFTEENRLFPGAGVRPPALPRGLLLSIPPLCRLTGSPLQARWGGTVAEPICLDSRQDVQTGAGQVEGWDTARPGMGGRRKE